jgi:hypothetical protein
MFIDHPGQNEAPRSINLLVMTATGCSVCLKDPGNTIIFDDKITLEKVSLIHNRTPLDTYTH